MVLRFQALVAVLVVTLFAVGSVQLSSATLVYDGIVFSNPGYYDYAPTALSDAGLTKVWWCAPNDPYAPTGDGIWYRTWNGSVWSSFVLTLRGTTGTWDAVHTCDPSVVRGQFSYQGGLYSYAMYYSGSIIETDTAIGVAFSNDGVNWVKRPGPVIRPAVPPATNYGAGMQTFLRDPNTPAAGWLAWYDSTWPGGASNVFAYTTDGINFGPPQLLASHTDRGYIGDIAYNPADGLYYTTFMNQAQTAITIYSFSDPTMSWTTVGSITSSDTGNTRNHNPAFLRIDNGNLYVGPGGIKYVTFGTGDNSPGTWELGHAHWY